jgi:hypothetical protein
LSLQGEKEQQTILFTLAQVFIAAEEGLGALSPSVGQATRPGLASRVGLQVYKVLLGSPDSWNMVYRSGLCFFKFRSIDPGTV